MSTIEKIQTFIILFAVTCGIVLGQFNMIHTYSDKFIVPFLFFMLYGLFLSIPLKEIKNGFRNLKFAGTSLTINFLWTPLLAWGVRGTISFRSSSTLGWIYNVNGYSMHRLVLNLY
ncbi:sodium bile acid symporter family protein [Bacillus sp. AG102]|nr:sodium bile acid symporter family protein [Bacillus sp. AG102]TWE77454.1 sodium bile acid symporter family protein [Bacillus thuringiensis]